MFLTILFGKKYSVLTYHLYDIVAVVEWLGVNEISVIFAAVSLAFGSYLVRTMAST